MEANGGQWRVNEGHEWCQLKLFLKCVFDTYGNLAPLLEIDLKRPKIALKQP